MKKLIILSFSIGLIILTLCLGFYPHFFKNDFGINETEISSISEQKPEKGVVIINVPLIKTKKTEMELTSLDDSMKILLSYNRLIVNTDTCNYFENSCGNLSGDHLLINLEYDLFIVKEAFPIEDSILFRLNHKNFKIPKSKFAIFKTYQDHLSNYLVSLKTGDQLMLEPDSLSIKATNYQDYEFEIIDFREDWVHLKTPNHFENIVSGWIKWISNDSLLIDPIYIY